MSVERADTLSDARGIVEALLEECRCGTSSRLEERIKDAEQWLIGSREQRDADVDLAAEVSALKQERDAALVLACTMVCSDCGDKRVFPPEDAEGAIRQYRQEHVCPVAKELERQLSGMRDALEKAPHHYCQMQTEPHCEHCHDPRDEHYWDSEWAEDAKCKDARGRPKTTRWSPVAPKPCNCWKSALAPVAPTAPAPVCKESLPTAADSVVKDYLTTQRADSIQIAGNNSEPCQK